MEGGDWCQLYAMTALLPGEEHLILIGQIQVGPKATPDMVEMRKICSPARKPSHLHCSQSLY